MVSPLLTSRFLPRLQSLAEVGGLFGSNPSSREVDGAVRGRATEMLAAFQAFLDHPIIGVGPGLYTPLYSVEYQQKNPNLKFRDLRVPRRAHMLYAETAAELGALGLSLFLAVVLVIARQLWKARLRWLQTRPDLADLATGFLLSIAAYLTTALTMHLSYQRYYWLLIALAAAAVHIMRGQATPGLEEAFRESAGSPTPSTSR
jgi:putative inorganic carbon (hco3(-)) transporter